MTVRIAESYFQRLLFETPALEAVTNLALEWGVRANLGQVQYGLARPEYAVTLCLDYTGQVNNGGHAQYFSNRGGRLLDDTLEALAETKLFSLLDVLKNAVAAFPAGKVPFSRDAVDIALERSSELFEELHKLDHAAWSVRHVDDALLDYLRENQEAILLPERGFLLE